MRTFTRAEKKTGASRTRKAIAAGQAARDVLAALYPSMRGELGAMLHAQLARIPGGHDDQRPAPGGAGRCRDPRPGGGVIVVWYRAPAMSAASIRS
jgi:hypothetical protein